MEYRMHNYKRSAYKNMLVDLGYKYNMETMPSPMKEKSRMEYPSLRLHKKIPRWVMEKEIGKELKFKAIGKIVSKSINEGSNGKDESVTIDVQKMGY